MKRTTLALASALALVSSSGAVALAGDGHGNGPAKPDDRSSKTIDLAVIGDARGQRVDRLPPREQQQLPASQPAGPLVPSPLVKGASPSRLDEVRRKDPKAFAFERVAFTP